MKKLREVLRLKYACGLKNRQIGRSLNISASTVSYYTRAFGASKLNWPLPDDISDNELIALIEPHCKQLMSPVGKKSEPNYQEIYQELKRKSVTLYILWEEYKQANKQSYSYASFCNKFRTWKKSLKKSMRQIHKAGEKCFIDYAGPKVKIKCPKTGEFAEAVIFVGVLGASNYTYAEATLSRALPDWIASHVRMLNFFGGTPELLIPDNEKAGVHQACYYDPDVNPNYAALAEHYNTTVLPTRPVKPQDKAKVEVAVQVVERWILARLRKITFYSLAELNQAIRELLVELNQRPFQKLPGCRQSNFEKYDKPALKPLPKIDYVWCDIKSKIVRLDYHVEIDKRYYSVPHKLVNQVIEYRATNNTIEMFHAGVRVASHIKSSQIGSYTTTEKHMPKAHLAHDKWSLEVFLAWAKKIGDSASTVAEYQVKNQSHPECCYRIHLGFKNLVKRFSDLRFEQACEYALVIKSPTFSSIKSILRSNIDKTSADNASNEQAFDAKPHKHLRGKDYYSTLIPEEDK